MTIVCLRSKFGYCKFGNNCDKTHYADVCETKYCRIKHCDKRHPIDCFFYRNFGRCKFENYCSYRHPMTKEQYLVEQVKTLAEEVTQLKLNLKILTKKLESIELENKTKELESDTNSTVEKTEVKESETTGNTLEDIIR